MLRKLIAYPIISSMLSPRPTRLDRGGAIMPRNADARLGAIHVVAHRRIRSTDKRCASSMGMSSLMASPREC